MKKFVKVLSFVLVILLCVGTVDRRVEAKSIYFAGKYNHTKLGLYLTMNQYSSPEGKEVGNFTLTPSAHVYLQVSGTLYKIKKNVYRYKEGKSIFTFTVCKKKVNVKMNAYAKKNYLDYTGNYKLKNRYYS